MKRFLTVLALVLTTTVASAQVNFFHGSWEELLVKAKKENKPFYVDFWATWCGPCKMMNNTTFQDPSVGAYSNKNYIAAKFDTDREGKAISQNYGIKFLPTIVFFNAEGKEINRIQGYSAAEEFLEALKRFNPGGGKSEGKPAKAGETGSVKMEDYLKLKTPQMEAVETKAFASVSEFLPQTLELAKARNEFDYADLKKKPLLS